NVLRTRANVLRTGADVLRTCADTLRARANVLRARARVLRAPSSYLPPFIRARSASLRRATSLATRPPAHSCDSVDLSVFFTSRQLTCKTKFCSSPTHRCHEYW